MSSTLTRTTARTRSTALTRTAALSRAEGLQFGRNKTLILMATVFPLGAGIGMFFATKAGAGSSIADAAGMGLEYFIFFALMFVQYYTVLSMATTRRDEGVMKRLRTGEARDPEILTAFAVPGALMTLGFTVVMVAALLLLGSPAPVNILPVIVAVVLGLAVSTGLALITSGFTKNAEAAQITSFPVMILAMASMGSIRQMFPDAVDDVIARTPFALIVDLTEYGWTGATMTERITRDDLVPLTGGEVLTETWPMMLMLLAWTVVCLWGAAKYVRWDVRS